MYVWALLATVFTLIYIYFKRAFKFWQNSNVPYMQPTIPIGNVNLKFFTHHGQELTRLYTEYKRKGWQFAGYYLFARPVLVLVEPETIKAILSKNFNHFGHRGIYSNAEKDPLTDNLFCTNGDRWRSLRNKLTPIFTSGKLKMMSQVMFASGENLVKTVNASAKVLAPIDIKELAGAFTTDIIASAIFGIECNSLDDHDTDLRKYGRKFFSPNLIENIRMVTAVSFPSLLEFFHIPFFSPEFTQYFCRTMTDVVDFRERTNFQRNDLMNLLIRMKNNKNLDDDRRNEDGISMNDLLSQCFIFYVAGFETSATTLTYCIFELARNQNVQDKLRKEIDSVLERHNGQLSYDAIMEMEYLNQVVDETLRKYPPVVVLNRECSKDFQIPGTNTTITKGTTVIIPVLGLHHDPDYYPKPDVFDPERFSNEQKSKRHPFTYLPFGEGPRNCIGLRFGYLEVKIGVLQLIRNFKLRIHPKSDLPLQFHCDIIILAHKGKIYIQAEKLQY